MPRLAAPFAAGPALEAAPLAAGPAFVATLLAAGAAFDAAVAAAEAVFAVALRATLTPVTAALPPVTAALPPTTAALPPCFAALPVVRTPARTSQALATTAVRRSWARSSSPRPTDCRCSRRRTGSSPDSASLRAAIAKAMSSSCPTTGMTPGTRSMGEAR